MCSPKLLLSPATALMGGGRGALAMLSPAAALLTKKRKDKPATGTMPGSDY